jgi:N-acetylmuramic acid 6-phosphate etherase
MPAHADIPDRSWVLAEQRNPRTRNLHELSVSQCVETIAREDRVVLEAIEKARPALVAFIEEVAPRFVAGGRLIYVGAGTSGRLGVLDASEAPPTFQLPPGRIVALIAGGDAALRTSSEGREDEPDGAREALLSLRLTPHDTILAIAAGGTTPYALGALRLAKGYCPQTLTGFLACSPVPKPEHADHLLILETGPEVVTGSTRMKAGTATKLALNIISTTLMIQEGRVFENLMVDLRATNTKLRDRAARIISTLTGLARDEAFLALDAAGGDVKTAVVMRRLATSREDAERRLGAVGRRLDLALRPATGRRD